MILNKNSLILVSLGLSIVLFSGCGSSSSSDTNTTKKDDKKSTEENNETQSTENNSTDDNTVIAGYESQSGLLIETRSDGTKRAWVNTKGDECLIYRIKDRGSNIADGGAVHCQSLATSNYGGIDKWRMPTAEEAVYTMANVSTTGDDKIIYPDDNPKCLFMGTDESKDSKGSKFVYTTNSNHNGSFSDASRKVAGIRCVANQ